MLVSSARSPGKNTRILILALGAQDDGRQWCRYKGGLEERNKLAEVTQGLALAKRSSPFPSRNPTSCIASLPSRPQRGTDMKKSEEKLQGSYTARQPFAILLQYLQHKGQPLCLPTVQTHAPNRRTYHGIICTDHAAVKRFTLLARSTNPSSQGRCHLPS